MIRNCRFLFNASAGGAGGLFLTSHTYMVNCVFQSNTTTFEGGEADGGGLHWEPNTSGLGLYLIQCQFGANSAQARGGAIYSTHLRPPSSECRLHALRELCLGRRRHFAQLSPDVRLRNSILWGDTASSATGDRFHGIGSRRGVLRCDGRVAGHR